MRGTDHTSGGETHWGKRGAVCLAVVSSAILITVVATWPSARYLDTRLYWTLYSEDTGTGLWWPTAFVDAVLRGENPFHATSLEWPVGEWVYVWNFGVPLLFAPIYRLARPIAAANLAAFAIASLNGLASFWVAKIATRTKTGALTGLFVGAASAYAWSEAGSGRQDQAFWAPVALYLGALTLLLRHPERRRYRAMTAGAMVLAGACYWYHAVFLVVASALIVLCLVLTKRLTRQQVVGLSVSAVGAVAGVVPFAFPVLWTWHEAPGGWEVLTRQVPDLLPQQIAWSFSPACFAGLLARGRADPSIHAPLLLLPAAVYAAWKGNRETRHIGCLGLAAALLAAGPVVTDFSGNPVIVLGHLIPLPTYFLDSLPVFHRLWWPHRWIVLAFPALAVGVASFVERRRHPGIWVALLGIFLMAECAVLLRISHPPRGVHWPEEHVPAVFADLAKAPYPAPILHLPAGVVTPKYLVWQPFHRQPIDQGKDWHIPGMVPDTYLDRLHRIALVRIIEQRLRGQPVAVPGRWTPEQTGGFCHVLLNREEAPDDHLEDTVTSILGAPGFEDEDVVLWSIPGTCHDPGAASPVPSPEGQ